jgi:hypothetical protein
MEFPWNRLKDPFRRFSREAVEGIMKRVDVTPQFLSRKTRVGCPAKVMDFPTFDSIPDGVAYFAEAINTELEHGTAGETELTNITDDALLSTAKIAAAHVKGVEYGRSPPFLPFPTYYDFLWWMEGLHEMAWERVGRV